MSRDFKFERAEIKSLEPDRLEAWRWGKKVLLRAILARTSQLDSEERERLARSVTAQALHVFIRNRVSTGFKLPPSPPGGVLPFALRREIGDLVAPIAGLPLLSAAHELSGLYTALLPEQLRAQRGAFYTPPSLAERLLDLSTSEGIDWATCRVLDPACGGGAFLVPAASRILNHHEIQQLPSKEKAAHLRAHLAGIELDPFAAWMTRVFLDLNFSETTREPLVAIDWKVSTSDALQVIKQDGEAFDLVVANPPFGRLRLDVENRRFFGRSLFGHANYYGLFLDAALRWRSTRGLVAFVTPTSFLGGRYFSKLRRLLAEEAPPLVIDIVHDRTGVFDSVQQETCLAVFGPNPARSTVVHLLTTNGDRPKIDRAGMFELSAANGAPWLLPRTLEQARLASSIARAKTRLRDLGYKASTGPLVWNRHKSQLKKIPRRSYLPLIWAEAVRPNELVFEYRARASTPFFEPAPNQGHLVCSERSVLVQRTTAKEQPHRLIACAVPQSFLKTWKAFVVENHVNMLRPVDQDAVSPEALAAVLNTRALDLLFRCISGSVAVSATELESLPMPSRKIFTQVAELLEASGSDPMPQIETVVRDFYEAES